MGSKKYPMGAAQPAAGCIWHFLLKHHPGATSLGRGHQTRASCTPTPLLHTCLPAQPWPVLPVPRQESRSPWQESLTQAAPPVTLLLPGTEHSRGEARGGRGDRAQMCTDGHLERLRSEQGRSRIVLPSCSKQEEEEEEEEEWG